MMDIDMTSVFGSTSIHCRSLCTGFTPLPFLEFLSWSLPSCGFCSQLVGSRSFFFWNKSGRTLLEFSDENGMFTQFTKVTQCTQFKFTQFTLSFLSLLRLICCSSVFEVLETEAAEVRFLPCLHGPFSSLFKKYPFLGKISWINWSLFWWVLGQKTAWAGLGWWRRWGWRMMVGWWWMSDHDADVAAVFFPRFAWEHHLGRKWLFAWTQQTWPCWGTTADTTAF